MNRCPHSQEHLSQHANTITLLLPAWRRLRLKCPSPHSQCLEHFQCTTINWVWKIIIVTPVQKTQCSVGLTAETLKIRIFSHCSTRCTWRWIKLTVFKWGRSQKWRLPAAPPSHPRTQRSCLCKNVVAAFETLAYFKLWTAGEITAGCRGQKINKL